MNFGTDLGPEITDGGKPVVLLLAARRWVSTARLAMALGEVGCRVEMLGPGDHPAIVAECVSGVQRYDPLLPLDSLRVALEAVRPTAVIAADELMVDLLEELWEAEVSMRPLIRMSLGVRATLRAAASRMELMRVAESVGVAVPETMAVDSEEALTAAVEKMGFPLVLKADVTSGGRGVLVVREASEVKSAWRELRDPPGWARSVYRGWKYKDWTHLLRTRRGEVRCVTAQRLVRGTERNGMVVCREGEVFAAECFEVVRTWAERGPSSVLRSIRDETMETAMRRVAARLGITGFCGFDFIVDEADKVLMIEMNLRPTQLVHLPLGEGRDLVAAYAREVVGCDVEDRRAATDRELIALFPQELQRDPESEFLKTAFHDVPWENRRLMELALKGTNGLVEPREDREEAGSSPRVR